MFIAAGCQVRFRDITNRTILTTEHQLQTTMWIMVNTLNSVDARHVVASPFWMRQNLVRLSALDAFKLD